MISKLSVVPELFTVNRITKPFVRPDRNTERLTIKERYKEGGRGGMLKGNRAEFMNLLRTAQNLNN